VIEDAAYFAYTNDISLSFFHEFDNNKDKTFTVFSGGKIFNMTGLRVGWAFGPALLIRPLKELTGAIFPSCVDQFII
jgi:aspartate/methionine/tyrosine aminotransferase